MVYRAHDPAIGRKVAIKLVRADLLDGAERAEYLARFQQEAQAAGRCTHPNIVAIYDFAIHDGNPFLAMEYVDGPSLARELARTGRLPPAEAVPLILQVLDALGAAHALGIVHRDIKTANILLPPDRRPKVTDFGIARVDSASLTRTGSIIGTPSYMSPEQCRGEPVDARSDLFSVGAVLFEMLAGERPFPGTTFTEVLRQVLDERPVAVRERVQAASSALVSVLERALAKRPEDRFPAALVMADAMRAGLSDGTQVREPDATRLPVSAAPAIDEAILTAIERRLATYVGPIARHLVRTAASRVGSAEKLAAVLADSIAQPDERARFLRSVIGARGTTGKMDPTLSGRAPPAPGGLSTATLERAQQALAHYVGPIARVLVRRAAAESRSETELWERLAAHIEAPAERAAFRRQQ